jgi:hypothetical protein
LADPFTIRIFVPNGDPDRVRLIDRMNWTGLGLMFTRSKWIVVSQRPELQRTDRLRTSTAAPWRTRGLQKYQIRISFPSDRRSSGEGRLSNQKLQKSSKI